MFENNKYATMGITAIVPPYLQNLIWYLIATMEVNKKDYLQVFELESTLEDGKQTQKIFHKQELPPYRKQHDIAVTPIVTAKIFVIDDGTHSTMLLASEY